MSEDDPTQASRPARPEPARNPAAQAALDARREREAASLRDNLRRRKAQARARQDERPNEGQTGKDEPTWG